MSLFNGIARRRIKGAGGPINRIDDADRHVRSTRLPKLDIRRFFAAALMYMAATVPAYAAVSGPVAVSTRSMAPTVGKADQSSPGQIQRPSPVTNSGFSYTIDGVKTANSARFLFDAPLSFASHFTVAPDVKAIPIDEAASEEDLSSLQPNTRAVLDEDELERLKAFIALPRGWDFGSGERLNAESVKSFDRFFAPGGFSPKELALFMSSEGNLVVSYSNKNLNAVEMEFLRDGILYFIDLDEESRFVSSRYAGDFRRQLSREL